jgi:hypothetical protein
MSIHLDGCKLIMFLLWNQMSKKSYIFISYDVMLKYVYANKLYVIVYEKIQIQF